MRLLKSSTLFAGAAACVITESRKAAIRPFVIERFMKLPDQCFCQLGLVAFRGAKGDDVILPSLLCFHGDHLGGQGIEVDLAFEAGHTIG